MPPGGRDPREIERSVQVIGAQVDKLDDYLAAGFTHIIGATSGPDYDLATLNKLVSWRDAQQS